MDEYNPAQASWGSKFRDLFSAIAVVLAALLLSFGLVTFVFQSYQVDGQSMETTLENNDRLVVWKAARTWARATGQQYVPGYGDIVVFNQAGLAAFGQSDVKQLVKRVMALPRDRIVVREGVITIYNRQHPQGFNPDTTLPYGRNHTFPYTDGNIDITLTKNQLFVCGDNRVDSLDSRIFGPINLETVIGKLVLRIYPFDQAEIF